MVQSLPVQRISVTGELEHTQAQVVQDIVQLSLAGGFLKADLQPDTASTGEPAVDL